MDNFGQLVSPMSEGDKLIFKLSNVGIAITRIPQAPSAGMTFSISEGNDGTWNVDKVGDAEIETDTPIYTLNT